VPIPYHNKNEPYKKFYRCLIFHFGQCFYYLTKVYCFVFNFKLSLPKNTRVSMNHSFLSLVLFIKPFNFHSILCSVRRIDCRLAFILMCIKLMQYNCEPSLNCFCYFKEILQVCNILVYEKQLKLVKRKIF
jgi:hypothetical protein